METIQMPFNGWVGKDYVVYIKNEMILSHKKNDICHLYKYSRTEGHHVNGIKPDKEKLNSTYSHSFVETNIPVSKKNRQE